MIRSLIIGLIVSGSLFISSCGKDGETPGNNIELSYGDSVFYLKNQAADYIIRPINPRGGSFTGFPDGIELNDKTGEVNVSKSETGLRYKISFTDAATGKISTTTILISGINYFDRIYNLSSNDTLALPVYNGTPNRAIPANSVFDEDNGCNGVGVAVDVNNATINLAATIRNGVFGASPTNGAQKEVEMKYRVNDGSGKTSNKLKVKLYYFNSANDIDADLKQLLIDRQGMVFGANLQNGIGQEFISGVAGQAGTAAVAKPRPPCIFIVGR